MKSKKGDRSQESVATRKAAPAKQRAGGAGVSDRAKWGMAVAAAMLALYFAYSPVMHTQFLFDDTNQQFALPSAGEPLSAWIGPVRPVLMFSYWTNVQISREDTFSYHLFNLVIHGLAAVFVFFVIRKLMEWAGTDSRPRNWLAAFGALVFLLHPLQTESVAYIAGRSESLSGMFAAGAIAAFLYRRSAAISWVEVAAVLMMFGAAVLSKEQAVVVPAVLLLTDFWWNPGFSLKGILRNWKLYGLMAVGAAAGVALFWNLIRGQGTGGTAGFSIKEFTWYQYLFTQFRSLWVYIGNFILPVNLNLDWDFPISRTIVDHGAVLGLIGLAALAGAAWYFRHRFRLAAYGFFLFLVLLLPTSSILPIKDPLADRRMYLPMIGLILIAIDFLGRLKVNRTSLMTTCGVVVLAAAGVTYARAAVWSDPVSIWEDTVRKSPGKSRAHFQLAQAYSEQGRFDRAVTEFEKAAEGQPPEFTLLLDWGLAYDGLHQPEKALAKFREAAASGLSGHDRAHASTQVGKIYADQKRWKEAMDAFNAAQAFDPGFAPTYAYKGFVHLANNDPAGAVPECQHALAVDKNFQPARDCLTMAAKMGGIR
jgi:tetratricopeptide (TPR) repeat protein